MGNGHLRSCGFSLIEVLIVIELVAVLMGMATLAFSTWLKK